MEIPFGIKQALENAPVLTKERERELLALMQNEDASEDKRQHARTVLIEANLRWVCKIAIRYMGVRELEDLFQLGIIGLIRAVDLFDLSYPGRLNTYATFHILQAILADVEANAQIIKLPCTNKRNKLSDPKILEQIERILQGIVSMSSMGRINEAEKSSTGTQKREYAWSDMIRDHSSAEEELLRQERVELIQKAIDSLPERERKVMRWRLEGRFHKQIAKDLELSEEASRQTEISARKRLVQEFQNLGLDVE